MVVLKSSFYLRFSSRGEDIAPDLPVVLDEFAIGCERGLDLRCADAGFDAFNETVIKLCSRLVHN